VGCVSDLDTYASLIYNGSDIATKILDWMYLGSTEETRLDRKFEKYIEYKKYIESRIDRSQNNNSIKYGGTIVPDFKIAEQIRFDYKYLDLNISQVSSKYNINRSTLDSILKNITHTKSDNRTNHAKIYLEAFGERKHILDWVNDERCNVDLGTLRDRVVNQKLEPEKALTKLPDSTSGVLKHTFEIDGDVRTITEILKGKGISRSTFIHRVFELGMDAKEASEKIAGEIPRNNVLPGKLSNNQKNTKEEIKKARELYKQGGKTVREISEIAGISESSLFDAISGRTFSDESYAPTPPPNTILITHNNQSKTIQELSDELGIPYSTIDRRYRMGLPSDQILDNSGRRLSLGKTQSEKEKQAYELAFELRTDYKNGLKGKALYEKYGIKKSRYIDIIGNRTCKEEEIWWQN
jgi:hypothetical protein